jgi:hypothetical protein
MIQVDAIIICIVYAPVSVGDMGISDRKKRTRRTGI